MLQYHYMPDEQVLKPRNARFLGLKAEIMCVTLTTHYWTGVLQMNGKFFDLKKEKQDRMINAALKVFALHGYRHASTDDIVKEAGISKGLLFHYFGNKPGVYQFVYDYSVRYMSLELNTRVSAREKDLFEVMKQTQAARMNAIKGYPYMLQFLARSSTEEISEILMIISQKKEILANTYQEIYKRIDYSTLPYGADGFRLRRLMEHAAEGLIQEHFEDASFQADMVLEEIVAYIDLLKKLTMK